MKTKYYKCNSCGHITDKDKPCSKCGSAGFSKMNVDEVKEVEIQLGEEISDLQLMLMRNRDL